MINEVFCFSKKPPKGSRKAVSFNVYIVKIYRYKGDRKWTKIHLKRRHVKTVLTIAKIARKKTYMKR